jgi:hypothetical protein
VFFFGLIKTKSFKTMQGIQIAKKKTVDNQKKKRGHTASSPPPLPALLEECLRQKPSRLVETSEGKPPEQARIIK